MRPGTAIVLIIASLAATPARALEVVRSEVHEKAGRYSVTVEVLIDAPRPRVEEVLTDYDNIDELHASFVESRDLGEVEPGVTEVLTRLKDCVAFFCKTLERVEHVRRTEHGFVGEDVPERSDFRRGRTVWTLTSEATDRTRLVFASVLEPDFWVPPIVGPALLGAKSRDTTVAMLEALERRAKDPQ